MNRHRHVVRLVAITLVLALSAAQPALAGWNMFSKEQEVELGRQAAADVEKKLPVLASSHPVSRYVDALGKKVARYSGENYPYTFKVVNQKEINAFALPGGPVYVNVGTIQAADNEGELAGVIGHEIAHITERHATENATKQMGAQIPLAVLGGMLGGGTGGQLAQLVAQFGVGSLFLKYGRDAEREADTVGAKMMYDAGYNPQAAVNFFKKLEAQGGARGPEFLSSHPNPGNRAANVQRAIAKLPAKSYQRDSSEFRNIKSQLAGLKPLSAEEIAKQQPQQSTIGQVSRQDVMPAGDFKAYQHGAFRISHPQNWEVFAQGQDSPVTIAPRAGIAENAVAYGVIINGFEPHQGADLESATHELIETLRQSNPEMRVVGREENIRVNGVAGKSIEFSNVSPIQAQQRKVRERDWLVALPTRNGQMVFLIFIAPEQDFSALRPAFEQMLRSFRLS